MTVYRNKIDIEAADTILLDILTSSSASLSSKRYVDMSIVVCPVKFAVASVVMSQRRQCSKVQQHIRIASLIHRHVLGTVPPHRATNTSCLHVRGIRCRLTCRCGWLYPAGNRLWSCGGAWLLNADLTKCTVARSLLGLCAWAWRDLHMNVLTATSSFWLSRGYFSTWMNADMNAVLSCSYCRKWLRYWRRAVVWQLGQFRNSNSHFPMEIRCEWECIPYSFGTEMGVGNVTWDGRNGN